MSPLRRWMTSHGLPSWYSWAVVIGTSITSSVLVLIVSLNVNQRALERERQQRLAGQQAWCGVIVTMDNAWRSAPPPTATGRQMAKGIAALRRQYRCDQLPLVLPSPSSGIAVPQSPSPSKGTK
jgi:hypothetical protein